MSSCDNSSTEPQEEEKTLTKSQLLDKWWYGDSGGCHYFRSDGTCPESGGGTWEWINDSDSMSLIAYPGAPERIWVFLWSTENEVSCYPSCSGSISTYFDTKWKPIVSFGFNL
ncbi:hypothetical protein GYB22_13085 [bacterium]|nr:hypothetical protein [bacterium]